MNKCISLILVLFVTTVRAQFSVGTAEDFTINPPKDGKGYLLYAHGTSRGWKEVNKGERVLIKKVSSENGKAKKVIEYEGKRVASITNNYYQNGFLIRSIVNYRNPNSIETFYYTYNPAASDSADVKGYKNGKLIYSKTTLKRADTNIETQYFHDNCVAETRTKTIIYWPNSRRMKKMIDHWNNKQSISFVTYDSLGRKIAETIPADSHSETYVYDVAGRLLETTTITKGDTTTLHNRYDSSGNVLEEVTTYLDGTRLIVAYTKTFRESARMKYYLDKTGRKDTVSFQTKRFDDSNNVIFCEDLEYRKYESDRRERTGTVMQYWLYDDKNRIIKYIHRSCNECPIMSYDVVYIE